MSKPVIVSGEMVGEDNLRQFLAGTEKMLGAKITVVPQWQVSCDDAAVMLALEALFGKLGQPADDQAASVRLTRKGKARVQRLEPVEADGRQIRSWRVLDRLGNVSEYLTIDEKNRKLAAGEFEEGAILHHPKAGKQLVIGAKGGGQGLKPVEV